MKAYAEGARLAPGNDEILFWQAATLWKLDREKEATPIFRRVFARDFEKKTPKRFAATSVSWWTRMPQLYMSRVDRTSLAITFDDSPRAAFLARARAVSLCRLRSRAITSGCRGAFFLAGFA